MASTTQTTPPAITSSQVVSSKREAPGGGEGSPASPGSTPNAPSSTSKRARVFVNPEFSGRSAVWWKCSRAPRGLERTPFGFAIPELETPISRLFQRTPPEIALDESGRWMLIACGRGHDMGDPRVDVLRFRLDAARHEQVVERATLEGYARGAEIERDGTARVRFDGYAHVWAPGAASPSAPVAEADPGASITRRERPEEAGVPALEGGRTLRVERDGSAAVDGRTIEIPAAGPSPLYRTEAHAVPGGGWVVTRRSPTGLIAPFTHDRCGCACPCCSRGRVRPACAWDVSAEGDVRERESSPWPSGADRRPVSGAVPDGAGGAEWGCRDGVLAWRAGDSAPSELVPLAGAACAAWARSEARNLSVRLAVDEEEAFWELSLWEGPLSHDPRARRADRESPC